MEKLIRGIVDFRKNIRPTCKEIFAELALGQKPDTLFIACSDSRVVPNLFASSNPGDLFVVRNVGNLVPPCGDEGLSLSDESEAAAIEFALTVLSVKEIVVCGHSQCGAMSALFHGKKFDEALNLNSWLRHGKGSLLRFQQPHHLDANLDGENQLSQLNVLEQLDHLKTYPVVRQQIDEGKLRIHGWWFDIREADVYEFDTTTKGFTLIDEAHAEVILKRSKQS